MCYKENTRFMQALSISVHIQQLISKEVVNLFSGGLQRVLLSFCLRKLRVLNFHLFWQNKDMSGFVFFLL